MAVGAITSVALVPRMPAGGVRVLVGPPVFKTGVSSDPAQAGSIPVRLREPVRVRAVGATRYGWSRGALDLGEAVRADRLGQPSGLEGSLMALRRANGDAASVIRERSGLPPSGGRVEAAGALQ
jgi:hypothetical protein